MKKLLFFLITILPLTICAQSAEFNGVVQQVRADAEAKGLQFWDEKKGPGRFDWPVSIKDFSIEPGYAYVMVAVVDDCGENCPLKFRYIDNASNVSVSLNVTNSSHLGRIFMGSAYQEGQHYQEGRLDAIVDETFLGLSYYTHFLVFRKKI